MSTELIEEFYTADGPAHHTYVTFRRYSPPDRVWSISGTKDSGQNNKYEEIRIGTTSYSRDNGAEWKVEELAFVGLYNCESMIRSPMPSGNGSGSGTGSEQNSGPPEKSFEYKSLGFHSLNGQTTEIFQETESTIFKNPRFVSESTTISKYWVNEEGQLLKWESIQRSAGSSRWSRKVTEYDYSTGEIKIAAPIK